VVLTAAVMAKNKKERISFETIIRALSDEYRKIGKQLVPELKKILSTDHISLTSAKHDIKGKT